MYLISHICTDRPFLVSLRPMSVKIKGLDAVRKKLQEVQTPAFAAKLLDDKFKHIRCPTHGKTVKHTVNATRTSATVACCCEELKALVDAKRGAKGSRASASPEVKAENAKASLQESETSDPQDPGEGSAPTT